jgi:hypothetical protein
MHGKISGDFVISLFYHKHRKASQRRQSRQLVENNRSEDLSSPSQRVVRCLPFVSTSYVAIRNEIGHGRQAAFRSITSLEISRARALAKFPGSGAAQEAARNKMGFKIQAEQRKPLGMKARALEETAPVR